MPIRAYRATLGQIVYGANRDRRRPSYSKNGTRSGSLKKSSGRPVCVVYLHRTKKKVKPLTPRCQRPPPLLAELSVNWLFLCLLFTHHHLRCVCAVNQHLRRWTTLSACYRFSLGGSFVTVARRKGNGTPKKKTPCATGIDGFRYASATTKTSPRSSMARMATSEGSLFCVYFTTDQLGTAAERGVLFGSFRE